MQNRFSRTEMLLGGQAMLRLRDSRVAVFGIGGVGGYCCEALARSGIGGIDLFDDDLICETNINRQLIATDKTVGRHKVDVMRERMLEINPELDVAAHRLFYLPEVAGGIDLSRYDYIVDAVDTVAAKLELAARADAAGIPIISAMGAANKVDPTAFVVTDIYKTTTDPLARVMRKELRRRGVKSLKVVCSKEPPIPHSELGELSCKKGCVCPPGALRTCLDRRSIPASNSFVPPVAGFILAGEVIKNLCQLS
jgi:tRNA A37 threonylcarbamoyladenosine dehydratase